jgi:hypothetical protein
LCAITQSRCGIRNACLLFQSALRRERRADPAVRIRDSVVSLLNKTQSVHIDDLFSLIDEFVCRFRMQLNVNGARTLLFGRARSAYCNKSLSMTSFFSLRNACLLLQLKVCGVSQASFRYLLPNFRDQRSHYAPPEHPTSSTSTLCMHVKQSQCVAGLLPPLRKLPTLGSCEYYRPRNSGRNGSRRCR